MSRLIAIALFFFLSPLAHADMWGGDLPLLNQIVLNTLHTFVELEKQTELLADQMDGIKDKINRIKTIADVVQPSSWNQWKNPSEALRRLRLIYYTMPEEYRSEKSQAIEQELSSAMNLISRISPEADTTFKSGKELEKRGADASPGVAQKLTASGVGTIVAMEAQNQIIQSHITSLLAQMLAESNEREARSVASKGRSFLGFMRNLGPSDGRFSTLALALRGPR